MDLNNNDSEHLAKSKPVNIIKKQQRKDEKNKRRQKRARIIIRNISYKAKDDKLKQYFEKYGKIIDLNILKKADGKLLGCAFIQYEKVNEAAKAILKTNSKPFLGRPIYVDWALGKNEYDKKKNFSEEVKSENIEHSANDTDSIESYSNVVAKTININIVPKNEIIAGEINKHEEEDNKNCINFNIKQKIHEKTVLNDIKEGCTIFIKNVPFDATNDDLRKVCRKYGPVYYAIINTDPISKHSKGTAFVKFRTEESAEFCLKAGQEFTLMNSVMEPFPALSRQDVSNKININSETSDSRNLYLVKEGLIMTGSKAAEGVSSLDMSKRHNLEQVKSSVLRDLNRFVSRNRLSIHNLPMTYDDTKLKNLIIKHTQLQPHECRVMRENKITPEYPKGKSKGFGFMSFSTHLNALSALRKLNNNPNIFGATNRPIVGFSIEDRSVHNIKEKRLEKSRQNNPNYQVKLEKLKARKQMKKNDHKFEIRKTMSKFQENLKKKSINDKNFEINDNNNFVGISSMPGSFIRMRSNKKIRQQSMEHRKKLSETKNKEKQRKQKQIHYKERKEIVLTKMGKNKLENDRFSLLVTKYKNLVDSKAEKQNKSNKQFKRSKWYVG